MDERALEFQRRVLGNVTVEPVDFWGQPIERTARVTREEKKRLKVLVAGLPCTHFSLVDPSLRGPGDRPAWIAIDILRTLEDPDIDLDATDIENVPAWALDPKIPAACKAAATERGWSMQIIKILTSHHGATHARKRILIFMEPESRTRDL